MPWPLKKRGKRWSVGLGPLRNDAWRYIQVQTVVSEKLQMLILTFFAKKRTIFNHTRFHRFNSNVRNSLRLNIDLEEYLERVGSIGTLFTNTVSIHSALIKSKWLIKKDLLKLCHNWISWSASFLENFAKGGFHF